MRTWMTGLVCLLSLGAHAAPVDRRACSQTPEAATPLPPGAGRLHRRVSQAAKTQTPIAVTPDAQPFCLTRRAAYISPAEVTPEVTAGGPGAAIATARLAYVLGAWLAQNAKHQAIELSAARSTGCTLARLGLRGDTLTTQLRELQDWSGPHPNTRAWMRSATEGYLSCAE